MLSPRASLSVGVLVAALVGAAGCDVCENPWDMKVWTHDSDVYAGTIEWPTELGSSSPIDAYCAANSIDACMEFGSCQPGLCLSNTPADMTAPILNLNIGLPRIDGPGTFTLPTAEVVASGWLFELAPNGDRWKTDFSVLSGRIDIISVQSNFDVRVDAVLGGPDGRTITVSGARFARLGGHYLTYHYC